MLLGIVAMAVIVVITCLSVCSRPASGMPVFCFCGSDQPAPTQVPGIRMSMSQQSEHRDACVSEKRACKMDSTRVGSEWCAHP